ncbi:MAG: hypothetical protein LUC43_03875, partial [Burkholderiales bacterium]|nr:hypothetical protein [Burkholderiales bacterium]
VMPMQSYGFDQPSQAIPQKAYPRQMQAAPPLPPQNAGQPIQPMPVGASTLPGTSPHLQQTQVKSVSTMPSEPAKVEKKSQPVSMREVPKPKDLPSFMGIRDTEWLKNEEKALGIFVMEYQGRKIRFVKDSARNVYISKSDISTILGKSKLHTDSDYYDQNDFVKVWTPALSGGRALVYMGEKNFEVLMSRLKGQTVKKFYNWFKNDAASVVRSSAPTPTGL